MPGTTAAISRRFEGPRSTGLPLPCRLVPDARQRLFARPVVGQLARARREHRAVRLAEPRAGVLDPGLCGGREHERRGIGGVRDERLPRAAAEGDAGRRG